MKDGTAGIAAKRDELLRLRHGFNLPGRTIVKSSTLISEYTKMPAKYPLRSDFQPRVRERGWAQFSMTFSHFVEAGQALKVSSESASGLAVYQLSTTEFELTNSSNMSMQFQVSKQGPYLLRVMLQESLAVDATYHLRFWATPLASGPSLWRFETEDVAKPVYPTNTNDGSVADFAPVKMIEFTAQTLRAPPAAVVTVALAFVSNSDLGSSLLLIVPETFVVLQGVCGTNCTCEPSDFFLDSKRQTATLLSTSGGALTTPLEVRIQLPPLAPPDTAWLLRGFAEAGVVSAWGAVPGFTLEPMRGVSVFYNAMIGSRNTRVIVTFEARVPGATEIVLRAPLQYSIFCRTVNALKQLALPGGAPICADSYGSKDPYLVRELSIFLNGSFLSIGQYAFGVVCDLPSNATAADSVSGINATWSLAVRSNGTIVESIYGIPPLPITNVGIGLPILGWSISEADMPSTITLGFTVEKPIGGVRAVLFVFPSRVLHNVREPSDFQVLGPSFPYISGEKGLFTSEMSMLRLLTIPNSTIPEGSFRFQFPVMLPWEMPSQNLWHLALCSTATCLEPDGPAVIVSFVLAGFNLGERSSGVTGQASSDTTTRQISGMWATLVALLWSLSSAVVVK